ncbi:MAG: ornithine cyclodeaminase family protein [Candidatus Thorarchaeota archaeon]
MKFPVIDDEQVDKVLDMQDAVTKMEDAMTEHGKGTLNAPPRFTVEAGKGSLVFTVGASTGREKAAGFRIYETFPKDEPGHTQLVVCYDGDSGVLKGVICGTRVGVIRTGGIGGVAIKYLSRPDSDTLAMIGSGTQARSQLEATNIVRNLKEVRVYSPTEAHREAFAEEMSQKLNLTVKPVESPDDAITGADIVISATRSKTPVYDSELLEPGMHVTTLGPNLAGTNEIEVGVANKSQVIVTDSIAQMDSYGNYTRPYFLSNTEHRKRILKLCNIVTGKIPGRESDQDITLFCSVGLAGTEVFIANEVFKRLQR